IAVVNLMCLGEISHRRQVGGEVDDLRAGRRGQKVEAKQADENENQEAARAGPEEAVIKTDYRADQDSELSFAMGGELWRVKIAEVFPPIRVESDGNQQEQNQRLEHLRADQRNRARAKKGKDQ